MNVVVSIPDEIVARLNENGRDLGRQALEALVLENFRAGRMTTDDVRETLGFEVLDQVDGFLKAHGVFEPHTVEDVDRQVEALDSLHVGVFERDRVDLAEAVRRRFAVVDGADDLVVPPREPMREPPRFES